MRIRLTLFRLIILLLFASLGIRLWQLQIVETDRYRAWADGNRFRLVSLNAPRGIIYDRQGQILVRNIPSFGVEIVPAYLPSEESGRGQVLTRLVELLDDPSLSVADLEELLDDTELAPFRPVVVAQDLDRETAFVVAEEHLNLPGVHLKITPVRQYTEGQLTAHILGYVGRIPAERAEEYKERGYDPHQDRVGLAGVEYTFEEELRGRKGQKYIEVDAAGREVRTVGKAREASPGRNLILTLDLDLQQAVEEALREGMGKVDSTSGSAIVLNPKTGEVLAMVTLPSYDDNLFAGGISAQDYQRLAEDPEHPLVNHAIGGQYPPGSTIKPILAAAGLEEEVISPQTQLICHGTLWLPNKYFPDDPELAQPFYCWRRSGHGALNVVEGLAYSCDIFFYKLGGGFRDFEGLGLERLTEYDERFGLGQRTGIGLTGETAELVPTAKWKRINYAENWTTGDTYNISIGQGFILVTPLQMVNATAAVANGGTLYRPQIVREVHNADGQLVRSFQPEVIREVGVSPRNLEVVRRGLRGAVAWGTARGANLPEVAVAGKTGTAEFPGPKDEEGNLLTHAWFTAFAPYEDPEIALVVFVAGGGEGTSTAVPIAAQILRYYFSQNP
ncbi:MAG: penicillin-binding protein 2 [Chloroflexota bacterium]|nr:penicillin-binding protein 2 [Chloroflexota bacterium]